jgi:ankyrin repeat protein
MFDIESPDRYGVTRLMNAICLNDFSLIKKLIKDGAHVNARNNDGCMPLHYALTRGCLEIALYLLHHGADPHAVPPLLRVSRVTQMPL